ncbi:MAG: hypothetical protein AAB787_02195 [Patescibacteria group bacterium]
MKLESNVQHVARDKFSTPIEWSSLALILVVVLGFFSTGCGDNPMAPILEPMGKTGHALLTVTIIGDSTMAFYEDAKIRFEALKEAHPEFDFEELNPEVSHRDRQRYKWLGNKGKFEASLNPVGLVFSTNKDAKFLSAIAAMEVIEINIQYLLNNL